MWIVDVGGECDLSNVDRLRDELAGIFAEGTAVVVDLSAASFIDSSVVSTLVAANLRADEADGEGLAVVAPRGGIAERLLAMTGVLEQWPAFETREEALRHARRAAGMPGFRIPPDVRDRIVELRSRGMSRNGIAQLLNRQSVPTAAGGKRWYASTVGRVLEREDTFG
jgi:anti-sigma B factor antagonist